MTFLLSVGHRSDEEEIESQSGGGDSAAQDDPNSSVDESQVKLKMTEDEQPEEQSSGKYCRKFQIEILW